MTARKYGRLLLVLLLPLLIAGVVLWGATGAWKEKYAYILCSPFLDREECSNIGPNRETYIERKKSGNYSTWVDVFAPHSGMSGITSEFVQMSARRIQKLTVIGVQPLIGSAQIPRNLLGEVVEIQFGISENDRSNIEFGPIILACNNIWFGKDDMLYSAQCLGEGWSAEVKFNEAGSSAHQLSNLRVAIKEAVENHRSEYFWFSAFIILVPLVLFFLFSALAWIAIKATRYVRAG